MSERKNMRKGFTFLYSYYRVFDKLKTDKQRAELAAAIFKVQFLAARVEEIAFSDPLVDIAFEGMKHSLAASVEGYLNKVQPGGFKGIHDLAPTPCQGGEDTPCQQEKEKEKEEEEEKEEVEGASTPPHVLIIADLNEVCGTKFSDKTSTTQTAINARIKDGHTLEDFKHVHRVKFEEWGGTEQAQWLRPATLYQPSKFDAYLQQRFRKHNPLDTKGAEEGSLAWHAAQHSRAGTFEDAEVVDE